jgi:hypothetical protein
LVSSKTLELRTGRVSVNDHFLSDNCFPSVWSIRKDSGFVLKPKRAGGIFFEKEDAMGKKPTMEEMFVLADGLGKLIGKEKLVGDLFEQYSGSDDENEKLEIFSLAAWVSGRRALAKDVHKLLQKVTQIPPEDETVEGGTQNTRDECRRFLDKAWAMLPGA